jgi:hypothetical protein
MKGLVRAQTLLVNGDSWCPFLFVSIKHMEVVPMEQIYN